MTNDVAFSSWYMERSGGKGNCTVGLHFTLLLICTSNSITLVLTCSCGEANFSNTGGRNFPTHASNCSSVSAFPKRKKTLSSKTTRNRHNFNKIHSYFHFKLHSYYRKNQHKGVDCAVFLIIKKRRF